MLDFPLVSVIIPAYNHEKYVQETIKSIIDQTYQNIELIIVDDGSKDSTWTKIQEMKEQCEQRFVRVVFETKKNEGTCKTLNRLINLSKGEYIYLIASDDLAKSNAIERELIFLSNNTDYALVVGDNEIIDSNGEVCYWDKQRNSVYDKKHAEWNTFGQFLQGHKNLDFLSNEFGMYHTLYLGNYIPNGYLIRKSIFEKTGLFTQEAPLEDYWLMLQISKYAKLKYFDEILFSYRWHEGNTIKNIELCCANALKTQKYEEKLLKNLNQEDILPATICFLKTFEIAKQKTSIEYEEKIQKTSIEYEEKIQKTSAEYEEKIQEISVQRNVEVYLLLNETKIRIRYIRYKIFSKILFGKKRKHYKEKTKIYRKKIRKIRQIKRNHR